MALPEFTPKDWKDAPSTQTRLSSANIEDLEQRLADHATASAQEAIDQSASALTTHGSDTTGVHGIADTTQLALKSETTAAIATAASYSDSVVNAEAVTRAQQDALKAPLASPALTGNPTAPTQPEGDESTKIATTAYADRAVDTLSQTVATGAQLQSATAGQIPVATGTGTYQPGASGLVNVAAVRGALDSPPAGVTI